MKTLLNSKTFWIAVIQAVAGIAVIALTELDLIGYVGIFKSFVDIVIRTMTTEEISSVM